ncbi:uncharacterized protein JCM6883_007489 [Sporobolomyces salmoneus]|uniref:uncharacterized protein n=1 Tax=Sporobolomyces salmoneus TaxID=183962 RepID=UPI00317A5D01
MSSFKKRFTVTPIPGTRPSSSSSLPLISTGLPTIDDLLGGGLPLSTSLLITQDYPTSYSELLLRYFIAQGLESNQEIIVISSGLENGGPEGITRVLMGNDKGSTSLTNARKEEDREDEEERKKEEEIKEKMKIAFRYEGMKQHQTTLNTTQASRTGEETVYCSTFDLTTTRQLSASDRSRLHLIDIDEIQDTAGSPNEFYNNLYQKLETFVSENGYLQSTTPSSPRKALRIAISSLGSPSWGSSSPSSLYTFLHRLRSLLRRSHASSTTTFPSYLYPSTSSSSSPSSILSRLSHASDSVLSLLSTSSSPSLSALYPSHQGLLTLPKLPSPSSLVPPSTKLSLLRNLGGGGQGRENLLGFRVKRRRFVVEVVSEEPEMGEEELEKKKRERRKRVEEANRKDREEGGKATDVLLGQRGQQKSEDKKGRIEVEPEEAKVEKGLREVRIGGNESEVRIEDSGSTSAPPASAFKKKKKGVRMGGVSFQTAEEGKGDEEEQPKEKKKVSISAMLHQQPELLDF